LIKTQTTKKLSIDVIYNYRKPELLIFVHKLKKLMGTTVNPTVNEADQITYSTLRFLLGVLGILLPFLLVFGNWVHQGEITFQGSMSAYYYTRLRDVFVGTMIAMGVFLYAYIGYPSEEDNRVGNIAGIAAIATALLPTAPSGVEMVLQNYLHILAALTFFIMLAYYCLVLFRRTDQPLKNPEITSTGLGKIWEEITRTMEFEDEEKNTNKIKRNKVYKFFGWTIIGSLLLLFVLIAVDRWITDLDDYYYTLILEAIATISFGIAWLVKSEKWFFKGPMI